jgi:hypothetical protein
MKTREDYPFHEEFSLFPGVFHFEMSSTILNIGRNMEITTKPTTTPRKTIKSGSIRDVRPATAVST